MIKFIQKLAHRQRMDRWVLEPLLTFSDCLFQKYPAIIYTADISAAIKLKGSKEIGGWKKECYPLLTQANAVSTCLEIEILLQLIEVIAVKKQSVERSEWTCLTATKT